MKTTTSTAPGGLGLALIATVLLIICKSAGAPFSWWWVASPYAAILILLAIFGTIAGLLDRRDEKRRQAMRLANRRFPR